MHRCKSIQLFTSFVVSVAILYDAGCYVAIADLHYCYVKFDKTCYVMFVLCT